VFDLKQLLTQKGLSASALLVLKNLDGTKKFERLGVSYSSPISAGECSWMSETLCPSAALRESSRSPVKQEEWLWLRAK